MKRLNKFKRQVIVNLKQRPENGSMICSVIILYTLNNLCFKKITNGALQYIMCCYFNDALCSILFLAYSNILFLSKGKEITKLGIILLYCFGAGLVWEYLGPVLKSNSITDEWDLLSYLIGGTIYWGTVCLYRRLCIIKVEL